MVTNGHIGRHQERDRRIMPDYQNDEGEWLMTDAEVRLEASLDAQSAEEQAETAWYDDFGDEPDVYCRTCDSLEHDTEDCTYVFEDDE